MPLIFFIQFLLYTICVNLCHLVYLFIVILYFICICICNVYPLLNNSHWILDPGCFVFFVVSILILFLSITFSIKYTNNHFCVQILCFFVFVFPSPFFNNNCLNICTYYSFSSVFFHFLLIVQIRIFPIVQH